MNLRNEMYRFLLPIRRKIASLVLKAVLLEYRHDGKMPLLKIQLEKDEVRDNVEMLQPYGMASWPAKGAEVLPVFLGGIRDHGVAVIVDVSGTRLKLTAEGDVAIYRDTGEKVYLSSGKILVETTGEVHVKSPTIKLGDATLFNTLMTKIAMDAYNEHTHSVSVDPTTHVGMTGIPMTLMTEAAHCTKKTTAG